MILANGASYDFKERVVLRRLSLEMRFEVGKRLQRPRLRCIAAPIPEATPNPAMAPKVAKGASNHDSIPRALIDCSANQYSNCYQKNTPGISMTLRNGCISRRELLVGISALPYALSEAAEMSASLPKAVNLAPLRARFKGDLIVPGDALYETARLTNNRVFDRHPLLIARCVDADDVARCL